ncbi:ArnT family glycosyltransferase [Desulfovibrio litoralis]|uniref:Dolichyl-phosphate-mannose-protein mannosyltransferase n=1 Tax=Desulfovibrio litoralis DSM 11393 TaxID=1121455 RepID=A0A1M7THV7_9BACT|nr:glycosyltransferase family 39 protein [Desulfovibrio litoralis]SHN70344.1 Dolichyl-phosphate-mannose-protein mannosyltransferase [Desulfovibrio litoralis DSM 11393]
MQTEISPLLYRQLGFWAKLWYTKPDLLAIFILGTLFVLRLSFILFGGLGLFSDEFLYWNLSRHNSLSYYDQGPLVAWLIAFWRNLFGETEFSVRFGAVFISTLTQFTLYLGLSRQFKNYNLALSVLLFSGLTPLFIFSGMIVSPNSLLFLSWTMALFSLDLAIEKKDELAPLIVLATAMAFGILSHYFMLAFFVVAWIYSLILYKLRLLPLHYFSRVMSALICGTALGLLPIMIWNAENNWITLKHLETLIGVYENNSNFINFIDFFNFLVGQTLIILPWFFALVFFGFYLAYQHLKAAYIRVCGLEDLGLSTDFSQPFTNDEALNLRLKALFASAWLPLFFSFLIWSFFNIEINIFSAGLSYIGGLVLAALGLIEILKRFPLKASLSYKIYLQNQNKNPNMQKTNCNKKTKLLKNLVFPVFYLSLTILFVGHFPSLFKQVSSLSFFSVSLKTLGIEKNLNLPNSASFKALSAHLEEIRSQMPDPEKVFFFSDSAELSSGLSFYLYDNPRVYVLKTGKDKELLTQYDFWEDPNNVLNNFSTAKPNFLKKKKELSEQEKLDAENMAQYSPRYGWSAIYLGFQQSPEREAEVENILSGMFKNSQKEFFEIETKNNSKTKLLIIQLDDFNGKWNKPSF